MKDSVSEAREKLIRVFGESTDEFIAEWKKSQQMETDRQISWLNQKLKFEIAAIEKIGLVLNGRAVPGKKFFDGEPYIINGSFLKNQILVTLFQMADLDQVDVESLFEDDTGTLNWIKAQIQKVFPEKGS
ncbi:MAG TPA: hypothetical protein VKV04_02530 [Verrucomicrobiae bacterium]|nr:hypothetical protein [Verrucomicrobiae bacterium]